MAGVTLFDKLSEQLALLEEVSSISKVGLKGDRFTGVLSMTGDSSN